MSTFFTLTFLTCMMSVYGHNRCSEQWVNYGRCYRAHLAMETRKNGSKIFAEEKKQITQIAVDCFNDNECRNPLPTDAELKARTDCFKKVQNVSRSDLQGCIRKDTRFSDFQLPHGNLADYDWVLVTSRIRQALKDAEDSSKGVCIGRKSLTDLMSCLSYAAYDYNQSSTHQRPYCSMKNECNRQGVVDGNCKRMWTEELTPVLCTCAQSLDDQRLKKYQNDYEDCVRAKGYSVHGGDPAPYFIIMQVRFCELCF